LLFLRYGQILTQLYLLFPSATQSYQRSSIQAQTFNVKCAYLRQNNQATIFSLSQMLAQIVTARV
jgi:hypothetical protein